jgi:solute:Na+ symporter, SSS family
MKQILFLGACLLLAAGAALAETRLLDWSELPPLPEAISGQAVGIIDGALVVAGGSNFSVSPWQGGEKIWKDTIWLLAPGADAWINAGNLPEPRAYGGAASAPSGMLIAGGSDGKTCFDDVLRLTRSGNRVNAERLPRKLPSGCAFTAAALLNGKMYVAGGQAANDATEALHNLWSLDLEKPDADWREEAPWPGPARMLPVFAVQNDALYLISGCELFAKPDGGAGRHFLKDTWRFRPDTGWEAAAACPAPVPAAASVPWGHAHILVFGGDDGAYFERNAELGDNHPGFPRAVRAYHTITDTWIEAGEMPEGLVTTQAVVWRDQAVVAGGEDRPGHRSASVLAADPVRRETGLGIIDYGTITLYLGALLLMGFWFSRREKDTETFFLGGRRVPWWAVGLSIFGTSLSAITYLSIPARAYATNWVWILANTGILFIAPLVTIFYLPRLREAPISTAYEYLEKRFNLLVRIYGSLCFIVFQIGRVGIVMLLPAIALSAATGLDIYFCIAAMGALATVYTALGGIEAVIWTDVLQAIVLTAGAVLALVLILLNVDGGVSGFFASANAADKFHTFDWSWDITSACVWVMLVGNAFSNLYPATADQTVVQRYLTTSSTRNAARAVWTNALLTIPISLLFFGLGTALWVYFRQHADQIDPMLKNDAVLPLFVVMRFPLGLRGILIAGIFAAAMSSLDSSINSVSSVLVNDYYRRFIPNVPERRALIAARLLTLIFGFAGTGIAMCVARFDAVSLWDPFLSLLNFVGGGLAGIFALGVFTKRANGTGAVAGAIAGTIAVVLVRQTAVHPLIHGMFGFLGAFLAGWVVSLFFPTGNMKSEKRV